MTVAKGGRGWVMIDGRRRRRRLLQREPTIHSLLSLWLLLSFDFRRLAIGRGTPRPISRAQKREKARQGGRGCAARLCFDERERARARAIGDRERRRLASSSWRLDVLSLSLSRARSLSLRARAMRCDRMTKRERERERDRERGKQESWRSTQGLRTLNFWGKRKIEEVREPSIEGKKKKLDLLETSESSSYFFSFQNSFPRFLALAGLEGERHSGISLSQRHRLDLSELLAEPLAENRGGGRLGRSFVFSMSNQQQQPLSNVPPPPPALPPPLPHHHQQQQQHWQGMPHGGPFLHPQQQQMFPGGGGAGGAPMMMMMPPMASGLQPPPLPSASAPPASAPANTWTEHRAPDGRPYWACAATGRRSWSKPAELIAAAGVGIAGAGAGERRRRRGRGEEARGRAKGRGARRGKDAVEAVPAPERREGLLLAPGLEGDAVVRAGGAGAGAARGEGGGGDGGGESEGEGGGGAGSGRGGGCGCTCCTCDGAFGRGSCRDERGGRSSRGRCSRRRRRRSEKGGSDDGGNGKGPRCCRRHCRRCSSATAPRSRRGRKETREEESRGPRPHVRHEGGGRRGLFRAADR